MGSRSGLEAGQDCKRCKLVAPNTQWFWAKTQASHTTQVQTGEVRASAFPMPWLMIYCKDKSLMNGLCWCRPGANLGPLNTDCFPSAHKGLRHQPARVKRRLTRIHSILTETKMNAMNSLKQQKGYIFMTNGDFVTFKNRTHNYLLPILSKLT